MSNCVFLCLSCQAFFLFQFLIYLSRILNVFVGPIHYHTFFYMLLSLKYFIFVIFYSYTNFIKVGYVYPDVTVHFISLKSLTFTDLLGMSIVLQVHPSPLPPLNFCFAVGFAKG